MNFVDELPEKCPPSDAIKPNGNTFYRIIKGANPTMDDFLSTKVEKPQIKHADECLLRSVSLFAEKSDCENVLKLPSQRGGTIFKFSLNENDGVVKKTFNNSHHSWWRTTSFNIP